MVAASSLLSRWFSRRMGSVMAAPYAAVGAGMLIFPPLTQVLLDWVGWRSALYVLGLGTLALLPLTLAMPLGRMTEGSREWRASRDGARRASGLWSLSAAMRTGAFWGLFAAYFWTSVAAYSVLPQSVAFLVEQGFNALVAASAFGLTGSLSVCGILAVGWLADRVGRLPTVTMTFLMSITGTLALVGVAVWPSLVLVYVFVVFFGLVQGARGPIILSLLPALYPGGAIGAIFGALSVALGLGAGLGPLLSGYLRQVTGGYVASFSMAAAASLCGLVTFWIVPSLRHERLGGRGGHAGAAPPARRDEREA